MESLPLWLLVVLIVAAVAAGLWVGNRAGALAPGNGEKKKSIGTRVRELGTRSVIGLYKWNRDRKKKNKDK